MQNAQNPFKQRTLDISVEGGTIFFKTTQCAHARTLFMPTEYDRYLVPVIYEYHQLNQLCDCFRILAFIETRLKDGIVFEIAKAEQLEATELMIVA